MASDKIKMRPHGVQDRVYQIDELRTRPKISEPEPPIGSKQTVPCTVEAR